MGTIASNSICRAALLTRTPEKSVIHAGTGGRGGVSAGTAVSVAAAAGGRQRLGARPAGTGGLGSRGAAREPCGQCEHGRRRERREDRATIHEAGYVRPCNGVPRYAALLEDETAAISIRRREHAATLCRGVSAFCADAGAPDGHRRGAVRAAVRGGVGGRGRADFGVVGGDGRDGALETDLDRAPATAIVPSLVANGLARIGLMYRVPAGPEASDWRTICTIGAIVSMAGAYALGVRFVRQFVRVSERVRAELDIAATVHETIVPPVNLTAPLAQVLGRSQASSEMGGDLVDVLHDVKSGRVDVLLGDVSGHGVGAGIVMAMLKSSLRTRLLRDADLGEALGDINRVLTDLTAPNMFATFAAARVLPGGRLQFALAGHLPILHWRAASNTWVRHPNESLPLGVDHDEAFVTGETTAARGDLLVMLTDGLIEVQSAAGKELSLDGFAKLIEANMGGADEPLEAIHARIMTAVAAYGIQGDDQSLVLVRVG